MGGDESDDYRLGNDCLWFFIYSKAEGDWETDEVCVGFLCRFGGNVGVDDAAYDADIRFAIGARVAGPR